MSDLINRKDVLDILDQCARDILFDYGLHGLLYECMEEIEKLQTVELCEDCVSRKSAVEAVRDHDWMQAVFTISHLPSVMPERKMGHCKGCKYFEYDSVAKVDEMPLIVAHEICKRWGDGCKTSEDGYCFLYEPQESEGVE